MQAQIYARHPDVGTEIKPVLNPVGLPVVVDVAELAPWACWRPCLRELRCAGPSTEAASATYEVVGHVDAQRRLAEAEWPAVLHLEALVAEGRGP